MYTRKERGAEAAWLVDERKQRWSNAHKAIAGFKEATGVSIDYARWASYESGKTPIREDHLEAFIEYFGTEPEAPADEDSALATAIREQAAAIDRQTAVLERLVELAEADRVEGPPWAEALAKVLGASLRGSHTSGSGGLPPSGAPRANPA